MAELLFEEKIRGDKEAFKKKLFDISEKLDFDPNWLMAVFNAESGVNPKARNTTYLVGGKPATGLIQWVEPTAQGKYGLSVDDIYAMDSLQQLDLVYQYFKPNKSKITRYSDLYRQVFFPAALGKGDDYVFKTSTVSADTVAKSNPVIDKYPKDNQITNKEFEEYALNKVPEPWRTKFKKNQRDNFVKLVKRNKWEIAAGGVSVLVALLLLYIFWIKPRINK